MPVFRYFEFGLGVLSAVGAFTATSTYPIHGRRRPELGRPITLIGRAVLLVVGLAVVWDALSGVLS